MENLIINVCKEFGINSWPSNPFWNPNSLPQEILKNKPGYLVLVSEFDEFRAELSSSHDNQIYLDIVKNSKDVGRLNKYLGCIHYESERGQVAFISLKIIYEFNWQISNVFRE